MGSLIVAAPTPKGAAMITFQVSDMTCGHCASAISRALTGVDKDARLEIRIRDKLVRVSSTASAADLAAAVQDAGYTARQVPNEAQAPATPLRAKSGCGGGSGCASAN